MDIFGHVKSKTNKARTIESLKNLRTELINSIENALQAKAKFTSYMNYSALELVPELDAYIEKYYDYCRAYYENEIIDHSSDEKIAEVLDQIDAIIPQIYETKLEDQSIEALNQYKQTIENANAKLATILQQNGMSVRTYIANSKTMARIRPHLDPYSRPIIASKFPKAKELYAEYIDNKNKAEAYYQLYASKKQEVKYQYPTESGQFEDITLPTNMYFGRKNAFRLVDEFMNIGEIAIRSKSSADTKCQCLKSKISPASMQ